MKILPALALASAALLLAPAAQATNYNGNVRMGSYNALYTNSALPQYQGSSSSQEHLVSNSTPWQSTSSTPVYNNTYNTSYNTTYSNTYNNNSIPMQSYGSGYYPGTTTFRPSNAQTSTQYAGYAIKNQVDYLIQRNTSSNLSSYNFLGNPAYYNGAAYDNFRGYNNYSGYPTPSYGYSSGYASGYGSGSGYGLYR